MANIELRHLDSLDKDSYIKADVETSSKKDYVLISSYNSNLKTFINIHLDVSTAIRFSKTIRTRINEIKKREGDSNE